MAMCMSDVFITPSQTPQHRRTTSLVSPLCGRATTRNGGRLLSRLLQFHAILRMYLKSVTRRQPSEHPMRRLCCFELFRRLCDDLLTCCVAKLLSVLLGFCCCPRCLLYRIDINRTPVQRSPGISPKIPIAALLQYGNAVQRTRMPYREAELLFRD